MIGECGVFGIYVPCVTSLTAVDMLISGFLLLFSSIPLTMVFVFAYFGLHHGSKSVYFTLRFIFVLGLALIKDPVLSLLGFSLVAFD